MVHKIEIEIKDDVLWDGLCRLSAESKIKMSELVENLTDVLLFKYSKTLIESLDKEMPGLKEHPEIKALIKQNESSSTRSNRS